MAALKIKYKNQSCFIECTCAKFHVFLEELEEKLANRFFFKEGSFEAFFSFPFDVSNEECAQLYRVCEDNNTYILGLSYGHDSDDSVLLEHCFFNGGQYELDKHSIYVGDIDKDVHVKTSKNLIVVGRIEGVIDLLHAGCEVSASSFEEAHIRIFDSAFQNVTNFAPCKVYYDNNELRKQ